jgi:hypothetical protein
VTGTAEHLIAAAEMALLVAKRDRSGHVATTTEVPQEMRDAMDRLRHHGS